MALSGLVSGVNTMIERKNKRLKVKSESQDGKMHATDRSALSNFARLAKKSDDRASSKQSKRGKKKKKKKQGSQKS